MIKKILPIFFVLTLFLNIYAQKAVYQLPLPAKTTFTNPTFHYTLPKTAFKVDVIVTKTTNIKGIYADFAEKMLGITNYCTENNDSYQLKKILITPFTVPDETLQFEVELSPVQMQNHFLQSLYANNVSKESLISSGLEQNHADILPDFFKNYADAMIQQSYETYTETKIIDGIVTQVPVTQTKVTTKSLFQQAQEAVDLIEKIRDDRYAILSLSQETTLSKEAFEYLVNQLNNLEKQYLELFTGITVFEDLYETFVVSPDHESYLLPLCSVSLTAGFSTSMCKTQTYNYYLKCNSQISTQPQVLFNEADGKTNKNKKLAGYTIRIAAPVFVSLVRDEKEEMLGIFPIYQFGWLQTLPANLDGFEIERWAYIY